MTGATRGFYRLIFKRTTSYPGLLDDHRALLREHRQRHAAAAVAAVDPRHRGSVRARSAPRSTRRSRPSEAEARQRIEARERALPALLAGARPVLVTGGTGLLGRPVVDASCATPGSRSACWPRRRRAARRGLPASTTWSRDLARPLDRRPSWRAVGFVVHCAAETAGGQDDHERNSIDATRHVFEAAARRRRHAGHPRQQPGRHQAGTRGRRHPRRSRRRSTPGTSRRGPYVWGKAESELLASRNCGASSAWTSRSSGRARSSTTRPSSRRDGSAASWDRSSSRIGPKKARPQRLRRRHRGARDALLRPGLRGRAAAGEPGRGAAAGASRSGRPPGGAAARPEGPLVPGLAAARCCRDR